MIGSTLRFEMARDCAYVGCPLKEAARPASIHQSFLALMWLIKNGPSKKAASLRESWMSPARDEPSLARGELLSRIPLLAGCSSEPAKQVAQQSRLTLALDRLGLALWMRQGSISDPIRRGRAGAPIKPQLEWRSELSRAFHGHRWRVAPREQRRASPATAPPRRSTLMLSFSLATSHVTFSACAESGIEEREREIPNARKSFTRAPSFKLQ